MRYTKQQIEARKKLLEDVDAYWPMRKGKNEFLKALSPENMEAGNMKELSRKEAILAMCYHCCGGYEGGPYDCKSVVCPLYDFMPYKDARSRKEMPEEQKQILIARLMAGRQRKAEAGI